MNHADFVHHVTRRADHIGLLWHYCSNSRLCQGNRGMPDLLFVSLSGNGILWAELKTDKAPALSPDQSAYKWALIANGAKWDIFTPLDLDTGRIDNALKEIQ
jgi:hypothetical protein